MKSDKTGFYAEVEFDLVEIVKTRNGLAYGNASLDFVAANSISDAHILVLEWANRTVSINFPDTVGGVSVEFFGGIFDDADDSPFIAHANNEVVTSVLHFVISRHPFPFTDEQEALGGIFHAVLLLNKDKQIVGMTTEKTDINSPPTNFSTLH